MSPDSFSVWLEAGSKAFVYTGFLLAAGACGAHWLVLPRAAIPTDARQHCDVSLARLLVNAAAVLLLGLILRLFAHTIAAFGAEEGLSLASLRVVALESRWSSGWQAQTVCGVAALAAALLVRGRMAIGWPAATFAILAGCVSLPLLGHGAADWTHVAFHAMHLAGGGIWLGTLSAIVLAGGAWRPSLLRRFTPVAVTGSALVLLAGVVMAVDYVARASNLWSTAYGRALSIKLVAVVGVLICGYLNWRQWSGSLSFDPSVGGRAHSGRLAAVESALALAVVLVTALLTELEHP